MGVSDKVFSAIVIRRILSTCSFPLGIAIAISRYQITSPAKYFRNVCVVVNLLLLGCDYIVYESILLAQPDSHDKCLVDHLLYQLG